MEPGNIKITNNFAAEVEQSNRIMLPLYCMYGTREHKNTFLQLKWNKVTGSCHHSMYGTGEHKTNIFAAEVKQSNRIMLLLYVWNQGT
jgi:hypothetical protein